MEENLTVIAADDEQDVNVLGCEELTDAIDIPVLATSLVDDGEAAVVGIDRLVPELGQPSGDRRLADARHAGGEGAFHSASGSINPSWRTSPRP
jgi:hypothetical protein